MTTGRMAPLASVSSSEKLCLGAAPASLGIHYRGVQSEGGAVDGGSIIL